MTSPLQALHEQAQAEMQPYGEIDIVSTFGNAPAEYAAIRKAAGKMDVAQRGVLQATGKDRLDFLNRILTNQTFDKTTKSAMGAGKGVYAYLLNGKGRVVADMNVLELGDCTWLETDARLIEPARALLEKYIIMDDVQLTSLIGSQHEIALHGPKAAEVLGTAELNPLESKPVKIANVQTVVFRDDPCGVPGYFIVAPAGEISALWTSLPNRPVGWAMFNAIRIEAGRPLMGIDFDDTILPAETGPAQLARAVSFTKGCYLGQEIVARMHARGMVARQLVGIRMDAEELPVAGSMIYDADSNAVGGITSSTISPVLSNAAICLGLVKKAFIAAGTELTIPAEGKMCKGRVVELPFVKVSELAQSNNI